MALLLSISLCLAGAAPADRPVVVLVTGAPGTPEYDAEFRRWADQWEAAAARGPADLVRIGESSEEGPEDRERLRGALEERGAGGTEPLWIVLIGHGTFDGREAKFNLRGPDVSDAELAIWLGDIQRPVVLVNCSSSSGPFLNRISGPNRVVVVATRSGEESNYARFGGFLSDAIGDMGADLDKDGQTSLLEAYLKAGGRVEEFYRSDSRLATEHSLLDDNGDGLGTPADWFRGVRAVKRAKDGAALDGVRASQLHLVLGDREREMSAEVRHRRDELELKIAALREEKGALEEDDYYGRLQELMVELAILSREARRRNASDEEAVGPAEIERDPRR